MTKTAEAFGCDIEIQWREPPYPPTVNNADITQQVEKIARSLVGEKWRILEQPSMGGEDFSFLARELSANLLLISRRFIADTLVTSCCRKTQKPLLLPFHV